MPNRTKQMLIEENSKLKNLLQQIHNLTAAFVNCNANPLSKRKSTAAKKMNASRQPFKSNATNSNNGDGDDYGAVVADHNNSNDILNYLGLQKVKKSKSKNRQKALRQCSNSKSRGSMAKFKTVKIGSEEAQELCPAVAIELKKLSDEEIVALINQIKRNGSNRQHLTRKSAPRNLTEHFWKISTF